MIQHPAFPVEPWAVRETELDLDRLAQTESVFALSNGHIGLRGNLDEGEPFGLPGTYLQGFYEVRPLPYAEAGYGYPEAGQTVVNVTNGKIIRLLVDDEPLDVRYGELRRHERVLDLRAGVLRRVAEWARRRGASCGSARRGWCRSPSARSPRSPTRSSRSTMRCGSSCSPSWSQTSRCRPATCDPRAAAALASPLEAEFDESSRHARRCWCIARAASGLLMAPRWTT